MNGKRPGGHSTIALGLRNKAGKNGWARLDLVNSGQTEKKGKILDTKCTEEISQSDDIESDGCGSSDG